MSNVNKINMAAFVAVCAVLLAGCASNRKLAPSATLGAYNFNYKIESSSNAGVIQAFDDGKFTYLKIFELDKKADVLKVLPFWSKEALAVNYLGGNLISVSGVYEKILVQNGPKETVLVNLENVVGS